MLRGKPQPAIGGRAIGVRDVRARAGPVGFSRERASSRKVASSGAISNGSRALRASRIHKVLTAYCELDGAVAPDPEVPSTDGP
jgi:hypothetical protein